MKYLPIFSPVLVEVKENISQEKINSVATAMDQWIGTINAYYSKKVD